jgi:hypothetical protein
MNTKRYMYAILFCLGFTSGVLLMHYTSPRTVNKLDTVKLKGQHNSLCIELKTALDECQKEQKQTRKERRKAK